MPLFVSYRILQNCKDDSLNVAVPMRMLEIFSSERTYLLVIPDANYVASLLEQILHYMVQKGKFTVTDLLFTLWIKKHSHYMSVFFFYKSPLFSWICLNICVFYYCLSVLSVLLEMGAILNITKMYHILQTAAHTSKPFKT